MCLFHLLHNFTLTNRGKKESKYWENRWHYLWMAPSKYMYSRLSLYYSCTHFWKTPWAQPGLFFLLGKKCLNSVLSFYSLLKLAFHTEGNFWHFYGTKDDEIVCFWAIEKIYVFHEWSHSLLYESPKDSLGKCFVLLSIGTHLMKL